MIDEFALAQYLDQTKLDSKSTFEEYEHFLQEAARYQFHSVAVLPRYAKLASKVLHGSKTQVCVGISYPYGGLPPTLKALEAAEAVCRGAEELDYVINVPALKVGEYSTLKEEALRIVEQADGRVTKAIIEVWTLSPAEMEAICEIAIEAGVRFIKTSTGYKGFADLKPTTVQDAERLLKFSGGRINIKVSGGVGDARAALKLIGMGVRRIGTSSGEKIIADFRALQQSGELEKLAISI